MSDPPRSGTAGRRSLVAIFVTAGSLVIAAIHVAWPTLKIDTITVILVVVALLPWLGGLVESIEIPGGGKVQYRKLEQQVAEISVQATSASQTAQAALGAAATADTGTETIDTVPFERLKRLAAEYTAIRAMPYGSQRTESMNRLFGMLIVLTPHVANFKVEEALRDDDPGMRLAAYAYLYARPDKRFLNELVAALRREDKHFSQYWAIRTIGLLIQEIGAAAVPKEIVEALRAFLAGLPEGTDRSFELTRLLAMMD